MRTTITAALLGLMLVLSSIAPAIARPEPPLQQVIVVFDDSVTNPAAAAADLASVHGAQIGFVYRHALKGFSAALPARAVAALERSPQVAWVEVDQEVQLYAQTVPTGIQRIFADENPNITNDGSNDLRIDVDVAVIDTGIDLDHPDLNVVNSTNCSGGNPFKGSCGSGGDDDNGHGTHVAGTIGALNNGHGVVGVAPGARLWAVKVLNKNGSGYLSWIIAGIDYVTANAGEIEVANMSLGGTFNSSAFDSAIATSVAAGVAYAVAAGNSAEDAATHSPANHPDVLTVSALADFDGVPGASGSPTCRDDQDDTLADFSNFGDLIDIAAPGVCILSTVPGGYDTFSGTSMASPHAAGALALLASGNNAPATKAGVGALYQTLIDTGNSAWTDDSGDGIQEPLLDVSNSTVFAPTTVAGSVSGAPTDDPPTVTITSPTDGTTVSGTVTITITANASDDVGVAEVEFFVGGVSIGVDTNGDDGWSASWDTTTVSDGTHTVSATATDTINQTGAHSVNVTVDNTVTSITAHVGDLDGVSKIKGKSGKWGATVTVTIHDSAHSLVAGATVTGTWTGAASGSISGVTGADGIVTLSTGNMTADTPVTFTVDTVSGDGLMYNATVNHDPDGDNDGTTITVVK